MTAVRYAGLTDVGRVRSTNEDCWFGDPVQGLFLVSDGMGGHLGGRRGVANRGDAVAPQLARAVGRTPQLDDPAVIQRAADAVGNLSHRMWEESQQRTGLAGMGATVVAVLLQASRALVVHLGDSRAYLLRDGHLERLTKDHTLDPVPGRQWRDERT